MIATPDALPEGSILFHPGFHKTGTTAVQSALASVRPAMAAEGVLYPSELRQTSPFNNMTGSRASRKRGSAFRCRIPGWSVLFRQISSCAVS